MRWMFVLVFLFFALQTQADPLSGDPVRPSGLADSNSLSGLSLAGSSGGVPGIPPWPLCDFGGSLPNPLIASDLTTFAQVGPNTHEFRGVGTIPGFENFSNNRTFRCFTNGNDPDCGVINPTGGPGNGPFQDFGDGGGDIIGLTKMVSDNQEDLSQEDAYTIVIHARARPAFNPDGLLYKLVTRGFGGFEHRGTLFNPKLCMNGGANIVAFASCANFSAGLGISPWPTDVWIAFGFRYDGLAGTYHIFQDGINSNSVQDTETGLTGSISNNINLIRIGSTDANITDVDMAHFSFFDSALTDAQILELATCRVQ